MDTTLKMDKNVVSGIIDEKGLFMGRRQPWCVISEGGDSNY